MKALIYGITGMDGSHLADLLLQKGYEVHGVRRRNSTYNTQRIDHLIDSPIHHKKFFLHHGDITDSGNVNKIISEIKPDELYELAANSHVGVSFEIPEYTANTDAIGVLRVIEGVRLYSPHTKVYFASTSECYGGIKENMPKNGFNEETPFHPRSPYGVAKLYGYWICKHYREAYNLFICCGNLFNHSSYRRGETFLTRKVTLWAAKNYTNIKNKKEINQLKVGNLYAYRDEGHSVDYVKAMWMMLQHNKPDDYVVATGKAYSIKNWINTCFNIIGEELIWEGKEIEEKGILKDGRIAVTIDPIYFRPTEVDYLLGDNSKIQNILKWKPKYNYNDIANEMINYDCFSRIPIY
jgi:GDPmannose 4,6-dehydratase